MAEKLSFGTSVREYTLNDLCTVAFSPTDSFFAEKLFNVFDSLSVKQDEYEKQVKNAMGNREIFDIARTRDAEMREMINGIFGQDVCSSLFPNRSVYAMEDGLPEWCNLLLTVMDVMDDKLVTEQKAQSPRVQKYTSKYKKYQQYHK